MNINIKNAVKVFFSVLISLSLFSGCFLSPATRSVGIAKKVWRCFQEQDVQGLKSMFCEFSQKYPETDEEIKTAMKFIEGEVISEPRISSGGGGMAADDGKYTMVRESPNIREIKTSADKSYEIDFDYFFVKRSEERLVGITSLWIRCSDGEEYVIAKKASRLY